MTMKYQWAAGTNDTTAWTKGKQVAQWYPNTEPTSAAYVAWKAKYYDSTGGRCNRKWSHDCMHKLKKITKRTGKHGHTGWNA